MSIQILDLVVYSHDGRTRALPLRPGQVNIITGACKTGKSALISIVDYCFGADECEVPGQIRQCVSWFGMRFQLRGGQAFIARRCPDARAKSSQDCFFAVGDEVSISAASSLRAITNTNGLIDLLRDWSGISDNLHEPPLGQTRRPLSATIRHALAFCFQPQDEIGRRQQLFHGASDRYVAQAIKDVLPYFLGAVDDDYVRKAGELRRFRDQLRTIDRQLSELKNLRGEGISKAATLLAQARDVGLSTEIADDWQQVVSALQQIAKTPADIIDIGIVSGSENGEYTRLSDERNRLLAEQRKLRDEIAAVRAFECDKNGFSHEANEQRARLVSIGIFEGSEPGHTCPLCSQNLPDSTAVPAAKQLKAALKDVSARLETVTRAAPHIEKAIAEIEGRLSSKCGFHSRKTVRRWRPFNGGMTACGACAMMSQNAL